MLVPVAVVGNVERLATRRRRRREVEGAVYRALFAQLAARKPVGRNRDAESLENRKESRHGIRRDAGGLQADGVGVEQRAQIVGTPAELIREIVKRRILFDGTGEQAADGQIAVLL